MLSRRRKTPDVVKNNGLERLGIVEITEAFTAIKAAINARRKFLQIDGHEIKSRSQRYELFMAKGVVCSCCGLKGQYFAIERQPALTSRPHLNLYGLDENNEEVLFTKDHIVAKVNGGANALENYQTMCSPCNFTKGSD